MTIYILDNNPKLCAQYLDDKSLDKMIRDIEQVLCNVHYIVLKEQESVFRLVKIAERLKIPLSPKKECKWSQWARECKANYLYLVELGLACLGEYNHRFDLSIHRLKQVCGIQGHPIEWARDNVPDLPEYTRNISERGERNGILYGRKIVEYNYKLTPFPLVMPKKYFAPGLGHELCNQNREIIESYRNYYQANCFKLFKYWVVSWTNRKKQEWVKL